MSTTFYIARHGQTDWNRTQRLQGWCDVSLNRKGWYQARRLAERLSHVKLDQVVTSCLVRTQQTASLLPAEVPKQACLDLNERRYGRFTGAFLGQGGSEARDYLERRTALDDDLDGGESLTDFHTRSARCFARMAEQHRGKTVLIVGHGGTNGQIVRSLQRIAPDQGKPLRPTNDTIYQVELPDDWDPEREGAPVWLFVNEHRRERVVIRR